MLTIYKYSGSVRAHVHPDMSSEEAKELMGIDIFRLQFSVPVPVTLEYGDYVLVNGRKFRLNAPARLVKNAKRQYEYSVDLESDTQQLGKVLYLFLDRYNRFTESVFPMTGTAYDFLFLLVENLKRIYPTYGYTIGYVVDEPAQTIDFTNEKGTNCLEALSLFAEKFETEWLVEGSRISLYKKQSNSGLTLKYGKGQGLYEMSIQPQTNSNPITRVYGYGSSRNLGPNYRLGARRLRMPDSLYLEKNTGLETGTGPYDIVETVEIFEDIYPRRNGVVSTVETPFIFTDNSMDFDVNDHLMPGVEATVKFTTGLLAGNSFTINNYDPALKKFTINANTEDQTLEIPSTLFTPAVGDEYVLIDILMPDAYIIAAEAELKQAVQDHLDKVAGEVPPEINVICDPLYFKETGNSFQLGQVVNVVDELLGINRQIRIIGYTRNYQYPYMYSMKLADDVKDNTLVKLIAP